MTVKQLIAQLSELPQDYEINLAHPYMNKHGGVSNSWAMLEEVTVDHDCGEVELRGEL